MKNLFLFLVLFVSNFVICQTSHRVTKSDINYVDSINKTFNKENVEKEFLILLNKYRKDNGLDTLTISKEASDACKYQTEYCFKNNILTHTNPNLGYENLTNRLKKFGLLNSDTKKRAECGVTFITFELCVQRICVAQRMLDIWKMSPPHNSILLYKDVDKIGIHISKEINSSIYSFIIIHN
jgi:uncharacterized protein YkwD